MKQQQQSQHNLGAPVQAQGANDLFKAQDPVSIMQSNFTDLNFKDPQLVSSELNGDLRNGVG